MMPRSLLIILTLLIVFIYRSGSREKYSRQTSRRQSESDRKAKDSSREKGRSRSRSVDKNGTVERYV